jgi:glycine/D-amino acid oxidase-like deaminating enzyme
MRLAVAGAGIAGASIALELARRGHAVDLYEREAAPFARASASNEGKLHLGYVYGNDASARTAATVLRGSIRFREIVNRWLPFSADNVPFSDPFYYAVHRDSIVPPAGIEAHFARVAALHAEAERASGARYLGLDEDPACVPLGRGERERLFDGRTVQAAWRTVERSIEPRALAALYRQGLAAEPKVRLHLRHRVRSATALDDGRVALEVEHDGASRREVYDQVANACWEGRLALDATHGLVPRRAWLHRFKLGSWLTLREPAAVPSVTVVLGPFGDVAQFGARKVYVSWYPACLVGASSEPAPPDWNAGLTQQRRDEALEGSLAALGGIVPALRALAAEGFERSETVGGVIFAWGASGIHDPASELHTRYDIGVHSHGGWHSVNTGRYCTAPLFALEACDRMLGTR